MSDPEDELRDRDWRSLVRSITGEKCILMLGPYADTADLGAGEVPVIQGLAAFVRERLIEDYGEELDDDYGPDYRALDPANPPSVAQAASEVIEDLSVLEEWVTSYYDDLEGESDVLAQLATLPFPLIVNTSPAPSVERVFRQHNPRLQSRFYDRTRPSVSDQGEATPFPPPSVDAPVLYNLYGSLDNPASLILSDNDRLDFLVSVITDNPPLPTRFKSALKDKGRSFLFLGFDLAQWQLRILLHVLARDADRRYRSFAAELGSAGVDETVKAYYRSGVKLSFFAAELPAFVTELRDRVDEARPAATTTATTQEAVPDVDPDGTSVFICHASEDKDFARRTAEGLQANGINPWLDKNDLRGGIRWDSMIERVLRQEVDYVVILQSASLRAKRIGYVNKEISIALERQQHYRGLAFVLPAIIDDPANALDDPPELRELQQVDMTGDRGIDNLVRAIKRDLHQRQPA